MLIAAPIAVAMAVAVWRSRSCGLNNLYVISGVRVIVMRAGTFVDLQKSMELPLREEVEALLYEAGIKAGRSSTKVLLREWEEKDFMRGWAEFYSSNGCGWFKLEKAEVEPEKGGIVRISGSFIAEEYGRSEKPVCHFLCGFLVGSFAGS